MANMFNEDGTYNKTEWKAGDRITAAKLNKIELSLEAINNNDIYRHVEADNRLDALEAKDVTYDKEFTNVKNLIEDAKDAAELGDYKINAKMTSLEGEFNEGMVEVNTRVINLISEIDRVSSELIDIRAELNNLINELNSIVVLDIT